jgi:hypothetical protein
VAGNLNHRAWADYLDQLAKVAQVHFVGENDSVIPPFLANDFVTDLPTSSDAMGLVAPDRAHGCCWESKWTSLQESLD